MYIHYFLGVICSMLLMVYSYHRMEGMLTFIQLLLLPLHDFFHFYPSGKNKLYKNYALHCVTTRCKSCDSFKFIIQVHTRLHTVAIWTFTFHEKSCSVQLVWKANFKPPYRSKISIILIFFYLLQKLSNPLLFARDFY